MREETWILSSFFDCLGLKNGLGKRLKLEGIVYTSNPQSAPRFKEINLLRAVGRTAEIGAGELQSNDKTLQRARIIVIVSSLENIARTLNGPF